VLFVIDNTAGMLPAKDKVARDLHAMVSTLVASPEVEPDLHLAMITTNPDDHGQVGTVLAQATRFAWEHEQNFDGELADAARFPITGLAGYSWPLDTLLQAVAPGDNATFLREDAYLAIVILTAGDDHSMLAPADAARMLKSVKSDPAKIIVTGAFGACDDGGITATAAPQLDAFLEQFPNRSSKTTLCANDLTTLTAAFTQLYKTTLGLACLEHIADPSRIDARLVDPETDETILYRRCTSQDDTRCYSLDPHFGCAEGGLAMMPRPWGTPFPALATLEYETR
jgi:hypothetical protein